MIGQSSSRKGLFFCHTNFSLYCLAQTGCCHLSSQLWQPEEVPTRVSVTPEWPRPIFLGSAQPLPGWFPGTATCSYFGEGQHGHSYLGIRHTPVGVHSIRREDRAILPDGTIYECQSTWIEDPRPRTKLSTRTQARGSRIDRDMARASSDGSNRI